MSDKLKWGFLMILLLALVTGAGPADPFKYRFPMDGSDFLLSGTFAELRTNHFHSGIDIKTGGETGKPLYAVRDGYVYRIKVSPYGFGKAIYLRHDDGEFTVYGHMDGFNDDIEEFVYQKQYASKRYEQEIYLPEDEMPVHRGQLIGYSGNSGSSQGPHLHFEIRDPEERIMNVVSYYQRSIRDDIPPIVSTIGIQAQDAASRVNGKFDKVEINPEGGNGRYSVPGIVEVQGRIGIEYHGYDLLSGAPNHCGINYARLYLDGVQVYRFEIDKFSFDEKKFINVHFDYPHYKKTRRKFQKAYVDRGNQLTCYPLAENRGLLELQDDNVHDVRLELEDTHGNNTRVDMKLRRAKGETLPESLKYDGLTTIKGETQRSNVFVCKVANPSTVHLRGLDIVYVNGDKERLKPAYLEGNELVYLLDLDKWRLPQSISDPTTGKSIPFFLRETILPEKNNIVEYGEAQCYFPYSSVFDSLPLHIRRYPGRGDMYSDIYEIGDAENPLFKSFVLNMRPEKKGQEQHMVIAERNRSGNWSFLGRERNDDGSIYAPSSSFGTFCVMADSTPPVIQPSNISDGGTVSANQKTLRLRITDNFAGIDSERILCSLDERWVLFEYDAKSHSITHRMRERPSAGKHKLHVMAYDNANNLAEKTFYLYF